MGEVRFSHRRMAQRHALMIQRFLSGIFSHPILRQRPPAGVEFFPWHSNQRSHGIFIRAPSNLKDRSTICSFHVGGFAQECWPHFRFVPVNACRVFECMFSNKPPIWHAVRWNGDVAHKHGGMSVAISSCILIWRRPRDANPLSLSNFGWDTMDM